MRGRDPAEPHRTPTPLELLFDLCFGIAVAEAAGGLHHDLVGGHVGHGVVAFLVVFFAIWWPWVNFTWFGSAYDTDDALYRLLTFVQIAGMLVVTAGVPNAFNQADFTIMVIGYVITRLALVAQWLRAAREDPLRHRTAMRFAVAISLIQVGWVIRLAIEPPVGYAAFALLVLLELWVPVWAERAGPPTPWNPGHVTERYGLFTIIVIGESVLAATTAVQASFGADGVTAALLEVALGGLLLVFAMWWLYFKDPFELRVLSALRPAIAWGYGHYVVFASIAAVGAGLQVAANTTEGGVDLSNAAAAATVAVPVATYLVAAGLLHARTAPMRASLQAGLGAVLVLAAAVAAAWISVAASVFLMGVVLVGMIAWHVLTTQPREAGVPAIGATESRPAESPSPR